MIKIKHLTESLNRKYSIEKQPEKLNEEYSLVGQDGNAFSLMGYTARCMKECGLRDEIDEMRKLAMSGDYYNLIRVCDDYIQKCNEINPDLDEAYTLTEKKWTYTLENGGRLRKAIRNEDYEEIIASIYDCYKELRDNNIIDEEDYHNYTEELDMYIRDDFMSWDDPEEIINYELNDLYDLCDNLNVWVSLDESLTESINEENEKYINNLNYVKASDFAFSYCENNWEDFKFKGTPLMMCLHYLLQDIKQNLSTEHISLRTSHTKLHINNNYRDSIITEQDIEIIFKSFNEYNLNMFITSKTKFDVACDMNAESDGIIRLLETYKEKYLSHSLHEDVQKEVFDKPGEFWYFTKHGVGPGSVPKGITIEKTIDKDGGEYFLIKDKILSTDALDKYEIKEKSPDDIEEDWKKPEGDFAGWVAIYQGKKIEIPKNEASSLYDAKLKAIEKLKVPKSKVGLLVVQPGYNESLESNNKNVDEMSFDELLELWWEMNGQWGPVDMGMEPDEIDAYFKENPEELKYNVEQGLK